MGKTNLKYQLLSAINESFREGTSKREVKKEFGKDMDWRIFSYNSKKDMIDTTKQFVNFLKVAYPDVKRAHQIQPEHIHEFLGNKNIRLSSLNHYRDRMKKLEKILNRKFRLQLDFRLEEVKTSGCVKEKLRDVVMKQSELADAIAYKEKFGKPCHSLNALKLCDWYGLRSDEPNRLRVENIDFEKMEITIFGKGGRKRVLPVKAESIELLRELTHGKQPQEKVCPIQGKSINKYLHEGLRACGSDEKYTDARSGVHAIRKMVAQREYDACRRLGKSREEAFEWVNVYLGHSEDRQSLNAVYVRDAW